VSYQENLSKHFRLDDMHDGGIPGRYSRLTSLVAFLPLASGYVLDNVRAY
jgi:hypothetical protein